MTDSDCATGLFEIKMRWHLLTYLLSVFNDNNLS
jgi:hypothetical protein